MGENSCLWLRSTFHLIVVHEESFFLSFFFLCVCVFNFKNRDSSQTQSAIYRSVPALHSPVWLHHLDLNKYKLLPDVSTCKSVQTLNTLTLLMQCYFRTM